MSIDAPVATTDTAPTAIQLRPYQTDALTAIERAIARGCRRPLIVLPTGAGKTVAFAEFIRRRGGRALVFVHRDELARQAEDKLRLVIPDADIGIVKAARNELRCPITIASVQTVSRPARLAQLDAYATIVIDEATTPRRNRTGRSSSRSARSPRMADRARRHGDRRSGGRPRARRGL